MVTHARTGLRPAFTVLKAPDVPSVLIELGYLSNSRDEQALRSPEHRAELARAIAGAIDAISAGAGGHPVL